MARRIRSGNDIQIVDSVANNVRAPLLDLHGNLRIIPFTSERGAQWLVLAIGGINVADAVSELIGTEGADSVRLVIYGGGE